MAHTVRNRINGHRRVRASDLTRHEFNLRNHPEQQLAALEALKQSNPEVLSEVVATAGLSLGEYTALVFAGALDFADGLRVVQQRGKAMQAAADATPGGMVSILGLEQPAVEELYDLQTDPLEEHNLAAKADVREMLTRLRERWARLRKELE